MICSRHADSPPQYRELAWSSAAIRGSGRWRGAQLKSRGVRTLDRIEQVLFGIGLILMKFQRFIRALSLPFLITLSSQGLAAQVSVGEERFRVGSPPGVEFGNVSGIAVLESGRVVVADRLASVLLVFESDGTLTARVGRDGNGPGELIIPCCVRTSQTGDVWVRPAGTPSRFDVFHETSSGLAFDRRIRYSPPGRTGHSMPGISADGSFSVRLVSTDEDRMQELWRFGPGGETIGQVELPDLPPGDSVGPVMVKFAGSQMQLPYGVPYRPLRLIALDRSGGFAVVITSSYRIRAYDAAGIPKWTVQRESPPHRLSTDERRVGEESLQSIRDYVARGGGDTRSLVLPEYLPPILRIWFDSHDRLWVQASRSSAADFEEADVFRPDGSFVTRARWPKGIDLTWGAIKGAMAWGVASDEWDVDYLVRVDFEGGQLAISGN